MYFILPSVEWVRWSYGNVLEFHPAHPLGSVPRVWMGFTPFPLFLGPGTASFYGPIFKVFSYDTRDQAKTLISACARQMDAQYQKVVFDEWAIISLADQKGRLLAYIGPRKAGFQKEFSRRRRLASHKPAGWANECWRFRIRPPREWERVFSRSWFWAGIFF